MNFNANSGPRQPFGRKVKRVSDVNAMGYSPNQQQPFPYGSDVNNVTPQQAYSPPPQEQQQQQYMNPAMGQTQPNYGHVPVNNFQNPNSGAYMGQTGPPTPGLGVGVFAQPMVQNMAMQYGQQMADAGRTAVKQEFEKYVPVSKLKYYFAVDTKYVLAKLRLIFFPFTHSDWSIKYAQDGGPVQPRFELNAPDLYIPTMAYVTYVLVAGLVLGMQNRFSPEQIGIQSSSALAWCLMELVVYTSTLYIANIQTSLRAFDLLAYSGYKFVGIIASVLVSLLAGSAGFYVVLVYCSVALAFFLVRSLKVQVLPDAGQQQGGYGGAHAGGGGKRRLYFLLFVAGSQPVLCWWLSFHLIRFTPAAVLTPVI